MGKKGNDLPKILRQELVLNIIENFSGNEGILTSNIYELLENKCHGVNRRTLYRDLQDARYPIYDEIIDGKTRWFLSKEYKLNTTNNLLREYLQKELMNFLIKKKLQMCV